MHNTSFKEGRKAFISKLLNEKYSDQKDKKTLTSEEMSGENVFIHNRCRVSMHRVSG